MPCIYSGKGTVFGIWVFVSESLSFNNLVFQSESGYLTITFLIIEVKVFFNSIQYVEIFQVQVFSKLNIFEKWQYLANKKSYICKI